MPVCFVQISSAERGLLSLLRLQHVNLVRYLGFSYSVHPDCVQISVSLLLGGSYLEQGHLIYWNQCLSTALSVCLSPCVLWPYFKNQQYRLHVTVEH